jgi:hypothetical protein
MSHPISEKLSRKRIFAGVLIATISVCLTLLALEILVRLLPPPYPTNAGHIFACDNTVGWIGKPNFQGVVEEAVFRQEITFNALGMHDTEHTLEKPADIYRILMLGDSFLHAIQVDEAVTAHQILENQLNESKLGNESFEIINSGVVNWGTNQQLIYYREQGRHLKPELVILMFYIGNDFQDSLPGNVMTVEGFNCYAPYFAECDGGLNPSPLPYAPGLSKLGNNCSPLRRTLINAVGNLYQNSRLYQQIEPLIVANWPRQEYGQTYPLAFTALYLPDGEPELENAYHITLATISQLRQEVEADGGLFAVALISPWPVIQLGTLTPEEREVFLRDNPDFAAAQADRPNQRLAAFLRDQQIPFIDLTGSMIEYSAAHNRVPLYITGEGHWTVEGNQIAADLLAEWLQTEFLLPE